MFPSRKIDFDEFVLDAEQRQEQASTMGVARQGVVIEFHDDLQGGLG
jgi:uncharacterized protein YkvS